MTAQQQQAMDSLYALDNIVTVRITMPPGEWDAVRNEQPRGGRCNFDWRDGARYTWRTATKVEISGTRFPPRTTFTKVGIKKKSFCGSINSNKPCLHIDFGKDNKPNRPLIEALIGTRYLTLNNSIQDASYVRQPLGYKLFELSGLPHSRCNFARVFVNGTPIGQGLPGVNSPGVFVNAEPIMPRYIERNFQHTKGNLYEIEHTDDFSSSRIDFIGVESLSEFDDKADLRLAIDHLRAHGIDGAAEVFDLDQFIRLYAMEFFLKHWDGYSRNTNNTYVYNNVDAVHTPGIDNVHFAMIPWGIDQTLQPDRHFLLGTEGRLAKLVRSDPTRRAQVLEQIRIYRSGIFGRKSQDAVLIPMLEEMRATLSGLGVPNLPVEVGIVRKQLRLAMSAGYLAGGVDSADSLYIRDDATNDCMHVSSQPIPLDVPTPTNFEVTHRPRLAAEEDTDLWTLPALGDGQSIVNKASGKILHASTNLNSGPGHKLLYAGAGDNTGHADEFRVEPLDADPQNFSHSGYFSLVSVRTGLRARFGADATASGAPRVHQEAQGSKLFLS
ncbi:CotH kinase family protein [Gordonia sp. CPCC 205515]|uniref:CotH kinase family protein n=1 Tax=Gordonia sp. CPCC 205515 TaxID=3140791 RepID=UPI003AF37068